MTSMPLSAFFTIAERSARAAARIFLISFFRYSLVSASGGVQPLSGIADALREDGFDIHMDIFVFLGKFHPACLYIGKNIAQAADDLFCFRRFNYALGAEHSRMGYASAYILLIHARIEGNGSVQRVRKCVCCFVKPS